MLGRDQPLGEAQPVGGRSLDAGETFHALERDGELRRARLTNGTIFGGYTAGEPIPGGLAAVRVHAPLARRPATVMWPAMPSSEVGAGVKRRSRSPRLAVNSHIARTATM